MLDLLVEERFNNHRRRGDSCVRKSRASAVYAPRFPTMDDNALSADVADSVAISCNTST